MVRHLLFIYIYDVLVVLFFVYISLIISNKSLHFVLSPLGLNLFNTNTQFPAPSRPNSTSEVAPTESVHFVVVPTKSTPFTSLLKAHPCLPKAQDCLSLPKAHFAPNESASHHCCY